MVSRDADNTGSHSPRSHWRYVDLNSTQVQVGRRKDTSFSMFYPKEIAIFLIAICTYAECITMELMPNQRRCLKGEIHKGVMVTGQYKLISDTMGQLVVDILVTDTKGHTLYSKEKIDNGKFAITTEEYDVYEVCFNPKLQPGAVRTQPIEVYLDVKHGVEGKNYEELGEAAKLKPLELELRRLEDLSNSIVQDFAYMRQREIEMRNTNESTNSRVLYLSIFSMCCLLGLATWQVLYLRRFFKAKKLIE